MSMCRMRRIFGGKASIVYAALLRYSRLMANDVTTRQKAKGRRQG
jgi:hypothetical protein